VTSSATAARSGHIYYIFQSTLQPSIYKLGITGDLNRRWREHGGEAKQKLIYSGELGRGIAYQVERQVKREFHHLRITDGNELFCLNESDLAKVIKLVQYHETAACQLRKAEAQRRAEAAAEAKAEAKVLAAAKAQVEADALDAQRQTKEESRAEELRRMAYHASRDDLDAETLLALERAIKMMNIQQSSNNNDAASQFVQEAIRPESNKKSHVATLALYLRLAENANESEGLKKLHALMAYASSMNRKDRRRRIASVVAPVFLFLFLLHCYFLRHPIKPTLIEAEPTRQPQWHHQPLRH